MEAKRYRILVLGAGFSRAAGFPLAKELWRQVYERTRLLSGRAAKFHDDLADYLEYKRQADGVHLSPNQVDFEDFMRVLDIEHFLELRGSDTWSSQGNEGTVVVKTLIGEILAELTPSVDEVPKLYRRFARGLQPGDYVLTFNYDVLLERALEAEGKPYRLFRHRYSEVGDHLATIDDSREEVCVLKMHGSIDWFDRTLYSQRERLYREGGGTTQPADPVFSHADELAVTKLLEGPNFPDDPLSEMYRVKELKAVYQKNLLFLATPWLLAPSSLKILYAAKVTDFWRGAGYAGATNMGVAIIGFSLSPEDEYARLMLYKLVTNYQNIHWGEDLFGQTKSPLVIVDRCPDACTLADFKKRYSFVDWSRAVLYAEGMDEKAVDLIFGQTARGSESTKRGE